MLFPGQIKAPENANINLSKERGGVVWCAPLTMAITHTQAWLQIFGLTPTPSPSLVTNNFLQMKKLDIILQFRN